MSTVTEITFRIPPPAESAFLWRRDFLAALRKAIGEAHAAGLVGTEIAIQALKALPPEQT